MKKSNRKTPLVFRVGLGLLCALFVTSYMMSGLYARYSTTVTGSATARVAELSYVITTNKTSSHEFDVNDFDSAGEVVAIEETFTIENTGEVTFEYVIDSLYSHDNPAGYQFAFVQDEVYLLSVSKTSPQKNKSLFDYTSQPNGRALYYCINEGLWQSSTTGIIAGKLGMDESHTIKVIYFIDFREASGHEIYFDTSQVINCRFSITQVD